MSLVIPSNLHACSDTHKVEPGDHGPHQQTADYPHIDHPWDQQHKQGPEFLAQVRFGQSHAGCHDLNSSKRITMHGKDISSFYCANLNANDNAAKFTCEYLF